MTASRLDILARLDVARESWDWPHVLDLMEAAGLTVDIADPTRTFQARVSDSGGGEVQLWWDRNQTVGYPPLGAHVTAEWSVDADATDTAPPHQPAEPCVCGPGGCYWDDRGAARNQNATTDNPGMTPLTPDEIVKRLRERFPPPGRMTWNFSVLYDLPKIGLAVVDAAEDRETAP